MFILVIGATTTRYVSVIKDMNVFFTGDIVVVARGVFVIQAFPIGGVLQESVVETLKEIENISTAVPMLFIINPFAAEGVVQLVPPNVTFGIPPENISILVGFTPLKPGGTWPSTDSDEAVIGPSLADNHNLTVGSVLRIKGNNVTVTGVLETRSAILSRAIIMLSKLRRKFTGTTC
jgi:hypothetical protein